MVLGGSSNACDLGAHPKAALGSPFGVSPLGGFPPGWLWSCLALRIPPRVALGSPPAVCLLWGFPSGFTRGTPQQCMHFGSSPRGGFGIPPALGVPPGRLSGCLALGVPPVWLWDPPCSGGSLQDIFVCPQKLAALWGLPHGCCGSPPIWGHPRDGFEFSPQDHPVLCDTPSSVLGTPRSAPTLGAPPVLPQGRAVPPHTDTPAGTPGRAAGPATSIPKGAGAAPVLGLHSRLHPTWLRSGGRDFPPSRSRCYPHRSGPYGVGCGDSAGVPPATTKAAGSC